MAKRRRRRSSTQLLAARTLIEIKQKRLQFLREVSTILSEALGFTVKVSLSKLGRTEGLSPGERRVARLPAKVQRQMVLDSFKPLTPRPGAKAGIPGLNDKLDDL